ncbi:unnamed protein product [Protopolystoma xenopodis]|uniref:tRNA-intron lyase n=1 Tax=Protopolystoma xenopodis TaxID=117903 RepID=A0A3S5BPE7_9PLAT|nr:unnamed protein product [Protopolystoma xenopodis]
MMPITMPAKRLKMYQCLMLRIMTTTMADDFGLDAFYIVALTTRPICDNEVNPLLIRHVFIGAEGDCLESIANQKSEQWISAFGCSSQTPFMRSDVHVNTYKATSEPFYVFKLSTFHIAPLYSLSCLPLISSTFSNLHSEPSSLRPTLCLFRYFTYFVASDVWDYNFPILFDAPCSRFNFCSCLVIHSLRSHNRFPAFKSADPPMLWLWRYLAADLCPTDLALFDLDQDVARSRQLLSRYAAYTHYRSRGWFVRPGLRFGGAHFLLYSESPTRRHAAFCVLVDCVADDPVMCPALHSIPCNMLITEIEQAEAAFDRSNSSGSENQPPPTLDAPDSSRPDEKRLGLEMIRVCTMLRVAGSVGKVPAGNETEIGITIAISSSSLLLLAVRRMARRLIYFA